VRIVYGVFGYGRGHATRALSVLPDLCKRHEVSILAGGDAYDALAPTYPVFRIPTLRYEYDETGERSVSRTFGENFAHVSDLIWQGPAYNEVQRFVRQVAPEVAICDSEPWSHAAAARLGIPRISFDHFGLLAYCRPPIPWSDRLRSYRDVTAYRSLMGRPDRIIVSSFYDGGDHDPRIRFVGPLLRAQVLQRQATRGQHLLVYLNRGAFQLTARIEGALRSLDLPVIVYGTPRRGREANLDFRAPCDDGFVDDLARCRAVFSTAGNQLVGEAIWFGKPMLVMPERTVEQRLNAAAVERLGIGRQVAHKAVDSQAIAAFLASESSFGSSIRRAFRDGRVESLAAIETFARQLALERPRAAGRIWRLAW
jgi:uncharacterized protein (TIGR00661 family)